MAVDHYDRPAHWAQNLLCFHYGLCRAPLTGGDVNRAPLLPQHTPTSPMSPSASLRVVPNPASTHTTFHYTLPSEVEAAHLVVMDAHGKRLDRLRATPPMGQLIWDTRKMPPGVYIVELLGTSGSLVRDRFVVQP
ncbi:MAG: T9SS type A sorting domain-containing protein [Flavobacteriales bacterium]|nr:T9SS type A sorting domain-containing protein [Flavobacteriales bacterium]NUQ13886.1 T9SS type A sorting domain-containing protein [Flavobacteriales bacterium]